MEDDVEGCGDTFELNGATHTCTDHNPGLLFIHSDGAVIWDNTGRYEDTVNGVGGYQAQPVHTTSTGDESVLLTDPARRAHEI